MRGSYPGGDTLEEDILTLGGISYPGKIYPEYLSWGFFPLGEVMMDLRVTEFLVNEVVLYIIYNTR